MSAINSRPSWSPQISLGNALQIVTMLVMVVAGYVIIDERSTANTDAIRVLAGELKELSRTAAAGRAELATRVAYLETQAARADERYTSMLALLERIDARLARMERVGSPWERDAQ